MFYNPLSFLATITPIACNNEPQFFIHFYGPRRGGFWGTGRPELNNVHSHLCPNKEQRESRRLCSVKQNILGCIERVAEDAVIEEYFRRVPVNFGRPASCSPVTQAKKICKFHHEKTPP